MMTRISASIFATLFLGMASLAIQASEPIQYIRPNPPKFEIPPIEGERYKDMVPYTLDLADMARLAVHGLTGITDPEADYEIYIESGLDKDPPMMGHDWNDWCQAKFYEPLLLNRIICGSQQNSQVDRVWMEVLLKNIGADGFYYMPMIGRPWSRLAPSWARMIWRPDGSTTIVDDPTVKFISHGHAGRFIGAMTLYYLRDQNPMWKKTIEKMIDRYNELAIKKDDYAYFPSGQFEPKAKVSPKTPMAKGIESSLVGWQIQGFMQYYKVTGYKPARELSRRLINYVKDHGEYFDVEGRFLFDTRESQHLQVQHTRFGGQFHHHGVCVQAMMEYAMAVDDRELMNYVKKSYEYARSTGEPLIGYFPEQIVGEMYPNSETCDIADMIDLAFKLSRAGLGDYWDDADRYIRNMFAECQMRQSDWVAGAAKRGGPRELGPYMTTDRVGERSVGCFAGWPSANDFVYKRGIQHCCTGNGARVIYYIWENLLDFKDGALSVNLLFNRASPWADVYSCIPYEGRVEIKMKKSCRSVAVRVPEWIEGGSAQVTCAIDGKPRPFKWNGRYINLGAAEGGQKIVVQFPIAERTVQRKIGGTLYTLVLRGNTVVFIDPPGKNLPIFQREYYRQNKALWHEVERFVSAENIRW